MKAGWQQAILGDVASVGAGNSAPQGKENFEGGALPFFRTSDVGKVRFGTISQSADLLNEAGAQKLRRVPAGTVLMPKSGASTFLNHRVQMKVDGFVSSHLATIKGLEEQTNDEFLLYYLATVAAQDLIQDNKYPSLTLGQIKSISIDLPPLEEQRRIVAVLDEAFAGLDRARTHAETNLKNAQELFENVLTHTLRHKFRQGEAGLLGDVCVLAQGLAINKGTKHLLVEQSSKPLLRIKDLRNNTVEQYVAEAGFPPKAEVTADDIIYTRTGQIGLVFRGFEGVLHNNCFSVRTVGDVSQAYLFWWLQEPLFRNEIISLASRAAQPDITHKLFKARSITYPNKDDQASAVALIESAFSKMEDLRAKYQGKIRDIDDLRQSLLQKAFAGELT